MLLTDFDLFGHPVAAPQVVTPQREAKKPDVMMRLTKVYAQYKTLDARQAAVRAEQNSVGNVVIESVAGSASGFLNNRMALDNAARSAFARWR